MNDNVCNYTLADWRTVNRYVRSLEIWYEDLNNVLNNADYQRMADKTLHENVMVLHTNLSSEIVKMNTLKNEIMVYLKNKVEEQK